MSCGVTDLLAISDWLENVGAIVDEVREGFAGVGEAAEFESRDGAGYSDEE